MTIRLLAPIYCGTLIFVSPPSTAQESGLSVNATATGSLVTQSFQTERIQGKQDVNTLVIKPNVVVDYQSKRFKGYWSFSHNHLRREVGDDKQTQNYAEYLYDADIVLIDNLLQFSASGTLAYQNIQTDNYLLSDFLLNAEDLARTRSNQYTLTSTLPTGAYFGASGALSYSDTQSERSADTTNSFANLDNNTLSARGLIRNGDKYDWLSWNLAGTYQETERSIQNNFISRRVDADMAFKLISHFGISINAQHEANQLGSVDDEQQRITRDYNSAGIGLIWREGDNRFISASINGVDSDTNDNDSFVGIDFSWSFSARTRVSGQYGRRFFGESGDFSLTHNTKSLRTQITYSEDVTTFSRLIANQENLGVFVCQDGSTDIAACFQPNTLEYNLEPGERFVQFSQQNAEINDEVILRKGLNGQLGYEYGRSRFSIDARYAHDEYLETERTQRTYSLGLNAAIKIGSYTSITGNINYAEVEQDSLNLDNGTSETWLTTIGISREIGQHLTTSLNLRYLDRDGTLQTGFGGQNVQDRRVTLALTYDF